jgi:hypothetical protein
MYYVIVATLMFAFPLLSIALEASRGDALPLAVLAAKWFVFWSVGAAMVSDLFVAAILLCCLPAVS